MVLSILARKWGHNIRQRRQTRKGRPVNQIMKLHAMGEPEETVWNTPQSYLT